MKGPFKRELKFRETWQLPALEQIGDELDSVAEQLDDFTPPHDACALCAVFREQAVLARDHLVSSGDAAGALLKAGLMPDMVALQQAIILDWARSALEALVAARDAHVVVVSH